ncbi:MAG: PD-(D/E)XK nuclease family protein [Desulfobacteraceae bacterium]
MSRKQALQSFHHDLHISHNQIFTYLNCSLKYKFHYVEGKPSERIGIALPFGSAIHSAIEMYYRTLKIKGERERIEAIVERFETCFNLELDNIRVPVIYKKETPDRKACIEMGKGMLRAFHENNTVKPEQIVDVELPLSARLYTDNGDPTDFLLVGILDLLLLDDNQEVIVVDNKTAAKPMSQSTADDENQMTAYSYLLAANKFVFPTAHVKCRFDVLRKLKNPTFEQVNTARSSDQRRRFAKIASSVLTAIDAGIHVPQSSWMCIDCGYSGACKTWHSKN